MEQYADPALLRDVATILLDCGLRPEECFRLRRANVTTECIEVHFGKTENTGRFADYSATRMVVCQSWYAPVRLSAQTA
jgi:hypothetical protein